MDVQASTQQHKKGLLWPVLSAVMVAALILAQAIGAPAALANSNSAVTSERAGVYLLKAYYESADGTDWLLQTGSSFFVNDDTVITCNHVIDISPELGEVIRTVFNDSEYYNRIVYKVVLMRDVEVEVTRNNASAGTDFAFLDLATQIGDHESLTLGNSDDVSQTQQVFALGFPDVNIEVGTTTALSFTANDVTVSGGTVSKIVDVDGTTYIQHSAPISFGNSGGPLVDENGAVVGINSNVVVNELGTSNGYSIAINQVKSALDGLGIDYSESGTSSTTDNTKDNPGGSTGNDNPAATQVNKAELQSMVSNAEARAKQADMYTEQSLAYLTSTLDSAKSTLNDDSSTQDQVNAAVANLSKAIDGLEEKPAGISPLLIVGIVVGVLIIAVVIIIIVVMVGSSKKRKAQAEAQAQASNAFAPASGMPTVLPGPTGMPNTGPAPAVGVPTNQTAYNTTQTSQPVYQPPMQGFDPQGAGETTVLNPAVGETSILGNQISASLLRVSNNERIRIDRPEFIIGKERRKVTYVIPDNSAISRTHSRISAHDGLFFIMDLNTTNFTFINDKKIPPNQEIQLNKGDHIKLADEEFIFDY